MLWVLKKSTLNKTWIHFKMLSIKVCVKLIFPLGTQCCHHEPAEVLDVKRRLDRPSDLKEDSKLFLRKESWIPQWLPQSKTNADGSCGHASVPHPEALGHNPDSRVTHWSSKNQFGEPIRLARQRKDSSCHLGGKQGNVSSRLLCELGQ